MGRSSRGALSRREFLKLSLAASSCAVLSSALQACRTMMPGPAPSGAESYYLSHRDNIISAFHRTNEGALQYLGATHGTKDALYITAQAEAEMERLLTGMPEVGGDRNDNTQYIVIAGWYAAYWKPMKALGKTPEDVGKMIYELNRMQHSAMPREEATREGTRFFSADYIAQMRRFAERTQRKEYPGDWVAAFVEGDGQSFDWGYQYTECGVVKYLRSLGLGDLSPYMCINDFVRSRALNTGLERATTLAEGYDACDFRYKWGRPVTRDWSTEISRIRTRIRHGFVRTSS